MSRLQAIQMDIESCMLSGGIFLMLHIKKVRTTISYRGWNMGSRTRVILTTFSDLCAHYISVLRLRKTLARLGIHDSLSFPKLA
jgi:hypothetical protein